MANIHIKLQQTVGQENNVPAQLVTKLYNLWKRYQNGLDSWDCNENSIKGTFKTGYTYDKYVETLHSFFDGNLTIIPDGYYIYFEDPLVESTIVDKLISLYYPNDNLEGVIPQLSSKINSGNTYQIGFRRIFYSRKANNDDTTDYVGLHITSFDELSKFNDLITLAEGEFYDCKQLQSVDLTRIKTLNNDVFRGCDNLIYFNGRNSPLGELRLPNLTYNGLKNNVFYWWKDSNNVYHGAQVKSIMDLGDCTVIGNNAFYWCKTLEYIDSGVLEKLETLNGSVFYECVNLTTDSFNVPNLKYIGGSVFNGCTNLIINDLKLPECTFIGSSAFRKVHIKKISELGLCEIGDAAFYDCNKLTEITDEALSNITKIGGESFAECTNLSIEELQLPKLGTIGTSAFRNTKIKKVTDLGTVKEVKGFNECSQLTEVVIPPTATKLGENAFYNSPYVDISSFIDRDLIYDNGVFYNNFTLPNIMLYKQEVIGITTFNQTNVKSIYMPNVKHTNGTNGTQTPYAGRGVRIFGGGSNNNMFIVYFKNLEKINGAFFGGWDYHNNFSYDMPYNDLRHQVNGSWVDEFEPIDPIPAKERVDPYNSNQNNTWANVRYVVFNNITPPRYWQVVNSTWGGSPACSLALYQHQFGTTNETFKHIAVPRSAINDYLNWNAWGTAARFNSTYLTSNKTIDKNTPDSVTLTNLTKFDNSDTYNPKVIALESMGHFNTLAEYEAAPEIPPVAPSGHEGESGYGDGIHSKDEFLIVEYMGLGVGETINWDANPTWGL